MVIERSVFIVKNLVHGHQLFNYPFCLYFMLKIYVVLCCLSKLKVEQRFI